MQSGALDDVEIGGITSDSRKAAPGFLFAALQGSSADGRRYIADAVARGAVAVLAADGTRLEASHLLVATGRTPTIDGLALDIAGIAHTSRGITVDDRLRTSNRNVWAIGDVNALEQLMPMQFRSLDAEQLLGGG